RGKGRARRGSHTTEDSKQQIAINPAEAYIQVDWQTLCSSTINTYIWQALQLLPQLLTQVQQVLGIMTHAFVCLGASSAKACNLMRGECARAHAALVATTMDLRLYSQAGPAANIQGTNALWSINFVPRHRQQIHRQSIHV